MQLLVVWNLMLMSVRRIRSRELESRKQSSIQVRLPCLSRRAKVLLRRLPDGEAASGRVTDAVPGIHQLHSASPSLLAPSAPRKDAP